MGKLTYKVNFMLIIEIRRCNPNGTPEEGKNGEPRLIFDDTYGLISYECLKRLIRDEFEYQEKDSIYLKKRKDSPEMTTKDRFYAEDDIKKAIECKDYKLIRDLACKKWRDVRTFGLTFTEESDDDKKKGSEEELRSESFEITGPVGITDAISVYPVDVAYVERASSVNKKEKGLKPERGSIGGGHSFIKHGLYTAWGDINIRDAARTGFSDDDLNVLIEALKHLFTEKGAANKIGGTRVLRKLIIWKQNAETYSVNPEDLFDSVRISLKEGVEKPESFRDYDIVIEDMGVDTEVFPKVRS